MVDLPRAENLLLDGTCSSDWEGSIYHAVSNQSTFLGMMGILATSALVMGLIHRKKAAILNIGFEQAAIFIIYVGGFATLIAWLGLVGRCEVLKRSRSL